MKTRNINFSKSGENVINPSLSKLNRHMAIAGSTGTGKTVTAQKIIEYFSSNGVPVFCTDIKGDLSGLAVKGNARKFKSELLDKSFVGTNFRFQECPVEFYDVYGNQGLPIRIELRHLGQLLLSRLLGLNHIQSAIIDIAFIISREEQMPMVTIEDLREILRYIRENKESLTYRFGYLPDATIDVVMRNLMQLEFSGCGKLFGLFETNFFDLMTTRNSKGLVNILAADELINQPRVYSTFLLWLLQTVNYSLEEIGDAEKPKFALLFDEAHLIFKDAPAILIESIERTVRLIRSKGVSIIFVSQSFSDIPDPILAQLNNRICHRISAYTPSEQRKLKAIAASFRPNPIFRTDGLVQELSIGQCLISILNDEGIPSIVERAAICPPESQIGAITKTEREQIILNSPLYDKYVTTPQKYYEELERIKAEQEQESETTENE